MIKVRVQLPDLNVAIDVDRVARDVAGEMRDFWADQLDKGKQPDGSALPLNKEGKPLGRGRGTLVRRWRVRKLSSRVRVGRSVVEPYTTGRYAIAVARLRARGVRFQTLEGAAAQHWDGVARAVAHRAVADAVNGQPPQAWEPFGGEATD